jgi:hypothetical protein
MEESMVDIIELIKLLENGNHEKYPLASNEDIDITEKAISSPLPISYKTFLTKFSNGAYLYLIQEVSAVGAGNKQVAAIQNIKSLKGDPEEIITIREGGETKFKNLVPFSLDSNGNAWCFITNLKTIDEEYTVSYFDTNGRKGYSKLKSFGEWLEILINEQEEVIRTLYDDNVITDELGLG